MPRLDEDRQAALEPKRMDYAQAELLKLGIKLSIYEKSIKFLHKGSVVTLWPYSGWHSGKTIKDGRGIHKLLKQLGG